MAASFKNLSVFILQDPELKTEAKSQGDHVFSRLKIVEIELVPKNINNNSRWFIASYQ